MKVEVPEKVLDLIFDLYDLVEPQIMEQANELKHAYSTGFCHGQQNAKDVLRDLIKPLLDSVNGDCCRGEEWEREQVALIRSIII